jgi:hypothetical protein
LAGLADPGDAVFKLSLPCFEESGRHAADFAQLLSSGGIGSGHDRFV